MNMILVNGNLQPESAPALLASNRGYRYGDGIFETMRIENGKIIHQDLHFDRLVNGLTLLGFEVPAGFTYRILRSIEDLAQRNHCDPYGRVRLSVYRGNGDLGAGDSSPEYIIECKPLPGEANAFNEQGLDIGIFPWARKSKDRYSNLKSASAMIYSEAARFAAAHQFDDCLVLNNDQQITDSTIANVFIVKDSKLITPALDTGCVDGVMRRFLIERMEKAGYVIEQGILLSEDIETADECFLTNAIRGIQWVGKFYSREFGNKVSRELHRILCKQ